MEMIHTDLHIHTLATEWDENFEFDMEQLKRHISNCKLNAVAVTVHNVFDRSQFDSIRDELVKLCFILLRIKVSALKTHLMQRSSAFLTQHNRIKAKALRTCTC